VVPDCISVTVTVTTDLSGVVGEVGVLMTSIDVGVPGVAPLNVEDTDVEFFVEFPGPEPVTPPVAPAALMRE